MKKLMVIIAAGLYTTTLLNAQSEQASKGIRFGLKVTPSVNWLKSGDKMTEKNGVSMRFGAGLMTEIRLTDVAVISTGLQLDMDGGKVKYKNETNGAPSSTYVGYFYDNEGETISEYDAVIKEHTSISGYFSPSIEPTTSSEAAETIGNNSNKYSYYLVNERTYSNTYITIPLALKLRTKEIGALTYFGMVGVNASFLYTAKATDNVQKYEGVNPNGTIKWGAEQTISKTKINKDMGFFNAALNMGAGVEWNLAGTTSLLFGLNYNMGFTNSAKSESKYLKKQVEGGQNTNLKQSLKTNSVGLTIGVLF
ncbi:MAG: outer membrane beta-barrel protein [Bacteroidia bacterium]|nr:outer membrane beta-barrel protein [Bacteroidia bacterium]